MESEPSGPSKVVRQTEILSTPSGDFSYIPLGKLLDSAELASLPFIKRIFLENVARAVAHGLAPSSDLDAVLADPQNPESQEMEFGFWPSRIILQDFTGVPLVTDLAAMRDESSRRGKDPGAINPSLPVDLVIDHSVQVDSYGSREAFDVNVALEMERNLERYKLLKWAQEAFSNFRVVPPGSGIVHQVNLEYLATVVTARNSAGGMWAFPDTVIGTDSHTTMISGIGVLGWGVGGIEAEAAMLGQPVGMVPVTVVGVRLVGSLPEGTTATDLVLTVTQALRDHGVVGKFVEFFGPGLAELTVPDRATVANMAPEYGATTGFFPVDSLTLDYLRLTGRDESAVDLVRRYCSAQGLFAADESDASFEASSRAFDAIEYDELMEIDLSSVEASLAGPRRPQDRTTPSELKKTFRKALGQTAWVEDKRTFEIEIDGTTQAIGDGSVVIAAITSCTNTSNPAVMLAAGLVAKAAVERGLAVSPTVKTSLAPGSPVVVDYLERAGLIPALEKLGFYVVGFGCTTCIGNSGPLRPEVAQAIDDHKLVCAAVLSGNRNFEGRIHPQVRLAYLASPPLVVAYALAGSVDIDLTTEPLGKDFNGNPVFLKDIWPSSTEIARLVEETIDPAEFRTRYASIFEGLENWKRIETSTDPLFPWDPQSTYIVQPPFVADLPMEPPPLAEIEGARALLLLGDSVTTDHISPAGAIPKDSAAGRWLVEKGVSPNDLHSYGARRGNFEVMVRGTFANTRVRNRILDLDPKSKGKEGGYTLHFPDKVEMSVFDAAMQYMNEGVPLVVLAGKEYGAGSSRDWAAKGTALLGVRAVIAESFERIHRSNLVQMGVLPLQLPAGISIDSLELTGEEVFRISGIAEGMTPRKDLEVEASTPGGGSITFGVRARIDSATELTYFREGGILPMVTRKLLA
jgi:aconitate hydratase